MATPIATVGEGRLLQKVRRRWLLSSWMALSSLLVYLAIVLPLDTFLPALGSVYVIGWLGAASSLATYAALSKLSTGRPLGAEDRLKKLGFFSIVLLTCFLTVDLSTAVQVNLKADAVSSDLNGLRLRDHNTWNAELNPERYYPTEASFSVYKPGNVSAGFTYGENYYPDLLQHQIIRDEVLERRYVENIH